MKAKKPDAAKATTRRVEELKDQNERLQETLGCESKEVGVVRRELLTRGSFESKLLKANTRPQEARGRTPGWSVAGEKA